MSKKNTAAPAAATQTGKPESNLNGLNVPDVKIFKGIFKAWARNVTDPTDPSKTIRRAKCVCQVPTKEDPEIKVDVTAWITADTAASAGITVGDKGKPPVSFVGTFAYTGMHLEAERGQYNEERSLTNATLVAVD